MTFDRDALMDAVRDAGDPSPKPTRECAEAFLAAVEDGIQSHEEWAVDEMRAILRTGSQERWKSHRKAAGILPARAGKANLSVQTVVGVTAHAEWVQQAIGNCDLPQLQQVRSRTERGRNRASAVLRVLDRLVDAYERHVAAPNLDDALAADGTTLAAVLERAS